MEDPSSYINCRNAILFGRTRRSERLSGAHESAWSKCDLYEKFCAYSECTGIGNFILLILPERIFSMEAVLSFRNSLRSDGFHRRRNHSGSCVVRQDTRSLFNICSSAYLRYIQQTHRISGEEIVSAGGIDYGSGTGVFFRNDRNRRRYYTQSDHINFRLGKCETDSRSFGSVYFCKFSIGIDRTWIRKC